MKQMERFCSPLEVDVGFCKKDEKKEVIDFSRTY
jgi:hypothetical protein